MGTFTKDDVDGALLLRTVDKLIKHKQLTQEEYDMMKNTANLQPKWYDRNLKSVVETSRRILENQKQVGYRECQNINIW